jgi:ribosomal protein S18 acetylase RimI-like enzyme
MPINVVERLTLPVDDDDLQALAELLVDAVAGGAGVSFIPPLPLEQARDWWQGCLASSSPRAVFLVVRDDQGVLGTVQLQPAWPPNQPHRADIAKLLVHSRARRKGIGSRLMKAIETEARHAGFRLLTLDTMRESAGELLYEKLGWVRVGIIPDYALNADGSAHDTVIFYKRIDS